MEFGIVEGLVVLGTALVALLAGVGIGRSSRRDTERIEELENTLADRARELAEAQDHQAKYQAQVVGHFSRTSDLLKEMTLQYRGIYQHLAEGARALCPEGALEIEPTEPVGELPEGADETLTELSLDGGELRPTGNGSVGNGSSGNGSVGNGSSGNGSAPNGSAKDLLNR